MAARTAQPGSMVSIDENTFPQHKRLPATIFQNAIFKPFRGSLVKRRQEEFKLFINDNF